MSDLHEVQFTWPYTEPTTVVVTGTFDEWTSSVHLVKNESGFHGSIKIPWDTKIAYKYVVDSNWLCETTTPTETDASGNVNNVYTSPPKPVVVDAVSDTAVVATEATEKAEAPTAPAAADPPPNTQSLDAAPPVTGEAAPEGATFSQLASDLVNTVAARDGTSSALEYVTSGLGAAIGQFGVDPVNGEKIAIETPKPDDQFTIPEPPVVETAPIAAPEPSPIAPLVPMSIVPVNAEENNPSTEAPTAGASVAPVAPLSEASVELPTPLAAPESEPVETPSTHTPLPASIPSPEPTPPAVAPETVTSPADVPSVPSVSVEVTPVSESKSVETPAPSEPPVTPASEPVVTAAVSELPIETATIEPAAASVAQSEKHSNGTTLASAPAVTPSPSTPVVTPPASTPATPVKNGRHAFPSSDAESPSSNNSSPSKFGTLGSRKNRKSIFGKIKGLFNPDKEEKEKK